MSTNATKHTRRRRYGSYWEPIYEPEEASKAYPIEMWPPRQESLTRHAVEGQPVHGYPKLVDRGFFNCDFYGLFESASVRNCRFFMCDFGTTTWKKIKFKNCTFERSSFTQATFEDCDFSDCIWIDVGISGLETVFLRTVINNPEKFITSAYTNLDARVIKDEEHRGKQIKELEKTKAIASRRLMVSIRDHGGENAYYEAIKINTLQTARAGAAKSRYTRKYEQNSCIRKIRLTLTEYMYFFDLSIYRASGFINDWGKSVGRTALFGFAIWIIFASIYKAVGIKSDWPASLMASADVTLLVGYTKHAVVSLPAADKALYAANMLVGLLWYAVFIPTLVNRISRAR